MDEEETKFIEPTNEPSLEPTEFIPEYTRSPSIYPTMVRLDSPNGYEENYLYLLFVAPILLAVGLVVRRRR